MGYGMRRKISTKTPSYPEYWRTLSGLPNAIAFLLFPSMLPVQEYIQSMPDLAIIADHMNDILSFYKEEISGDTANYISLRAASRAITKLDALREVIDQTVQAHHNILESWKPHTEAYDAYVSFFHGYVRFHCTPRYKLEEIMSERSSCDDS
ncbi:terpenoid synthase [Rhizopogon vinicolor AM-OR11-026]|uniref:Terpenoid synthase n=1 Tax=Rhizopogon vinicolor AM-OR11-026 TaxID=1314800 RepID=A0A1B7MHL1_9AGAM|nr:terpenoid synthase [Rhizopogon vinicolor AM-OR11-026]